VHDGSTSNFLTGPFFVNFTGGAYDGPQFQVSNNSSFSPTGGSNVTDTYYGRVQACVPTMLEGNCLQYGASWKPTGLIQQNANRMQFGVFGYPLDSTQSRPKGVVRGRLKQVGPQTINPSGAGVSNPVAEFSAADGTFVANPDTADAAASGVTQSGVINYTTSTWTPRGLRPTWTSRGRAGIRR